MADSEKLINELLKKLNTGFSDQDSFNSLYEFVESDLKSLSQGLLQSWKPSPEQEKKLGMLLAIPGIHVQAKIVEKLSQGNKVSGFEALSGDKTFYVMIKLEMKSVKKCNPPMEVSEARLEKYDSFIKFVKEKFERLLKIDDSIFIINSSEHPTLEKQQKISFNLAD
ncbi:23086_t:CDS:2 [Gigaspora margarita]|uniref:23086_t:CDS:1 n=1 Tax=Gigaspora margarita TaxID=4874 RepID=A0ABM8VVJ3_GIGMA|nr:23086_t:CDS:2 [Gigaspora margarita]